MPNIANNPIIETLRANDAQMAASRDLTGKNRMAAERWQKRFGGTVTRDSEGDYYVVNYTSKSGSTLSCRFEDGAPKIPAPEPADTDPTQERLTSFNAADLMGMEFPPVRYIVPGYIAEGCTILAGASKLGKSWLVLQAAVAVANGSTCLGGQCDQGDVLYLALEDNPRRLKDRLRKQHPAMGLTGQQMPACLQFETEWPRADQGGLQKIADWLAEHPNAKLVIIDVLKMFRANRKGNKNPYDLDYEDINPLSKIAAEFNVAIVIVHHTNKGALSSDPFDRVNGTGGISGAADTTLIMARNDEGLIELYGRGREIEEIETAMSFIKETCTWSVRGNARSRGRRRARRPAPCSDPRPFPAARSARHPRP